MEATGGAASHRRQNKDTGVGSIASIRRREQTVGFGKDRREALLKAKRFRVSRGGDRNDEGKEDHYSQPASMEDEESARKASVERIVKVVEKLQVAVNGPAKGSAQAKTSALRDLRQQLSKETEPPLAAAVQAGVVPLLISCLGFGVPEEQLVDAVWCLSNIAGGDAQQAAAVFPASALLIAHLGERSPEPVIDHCAWAISNLAAEGPETTSILLKQGALSALSRVLLTASATPGKENLAQTAAWALSNVLKAADPRTAVELIRTDGVPSTLVNLLGRGNLQLAAEVAWVLVYVTAKSDACTERLLAGGVAGPLLALLGSSNEPITLTPVVRTIGNITAMDNSKMDIILAAGSSISGGALGALARCLENPHRTIQKEVAWAFSNIAGGSREHKEALLGSSAMAPLLRLFSSASFDVRKEVAFALGNLCVFPVPIQRTPSTIPEVNVSVLDQFVKAGCLPGFVLLVRSPDLEASRLGLQFLELVMRALPNSQGPKLVEAEDGIDALESLQFHGNDELRAMANHLVDKYFGEDYGLDEEYGSGTSESLNGKGDVQYPPWRGGSNKSS